GGLNELARRALRVELHDAHRQTVRFRVVLAVTGDALLEHRLGPRRERQPFLDVRGDVTETGDRRSALWWRRRGALPAEAAHAAPDTREIGFAVGGARRRRGEIRFALLRFRRVLR